MEEEIKFKIDTYYSDWTPVSKVKIIPKCSDKETRCVIKEIYSADGPYILGTVIFIPHLERKYCLKMKTK